MVYKRFRRYGYRGYRTMYRVGTTMGKLAYRHGGSSLSTAAKALAIARATAALVNVEHKKADASQAADAIDTTGTVSYLNNLTQGDGDNNRDGNSVRAKSLLVNLKCTPNATATTSAMVRVLILWDNQQVADTDPSLAQLLEDSNNPLSPLNNETVGRFTVIKDIRFCTNPTNKTAIQKNIYIKLNRHCRYNGTTASDIQKNGLYMIYFSDAVTNAPTMDWFSRFTFIDN